MNPVIVLVTEGKNDGKPDFITVKLFPNTETAKLFCANNQVGGKYWKICDIVNEDEQIDIGSFEY